MVQTPSFRSLSCYAHIHSEHLLLDPDTLLSKLLADDLHMFVCLLQRLEFNDVFCMFEAGPSARALAPHQPKSDGGCAIAIDDVGDGRVDPPQLDPGDETFF